MSDENGSGTVAPGVTPAPGGAFDWLIESHQQSAPMAPLSDDFPPPTLAAPSFGIQDPAAIPATAYPDPFSSMPGGPAAAPSFFAQPVSAAPTPTPVVTTIPPPPTLAASPLSPPLSPTAWSPPPRPSEPPVGQVPIAQAPVDQIPVARIPVAQAPIAPPPVASAPVAEPPARAFLPPVAPAIATAPPMAQQGAFSFTAEPSAPSSFVGGLGPSPFALERRATQARSGNGPLDWAALALAFLAPPIGLLVGIAAVVSDSRTKGYSEGIAKAAIGIGAGLTLVLGVAFAVVTKINNDHAAHASIVASSRAWCTKLKSNPVTLSSDTFGWPAPGNTVPESITAMTTYESYWTSLAKVAPTGIRTDTQKVADAAKSIVATVKSTETLNNAGNIAQMQDVVATSGIHTWVSSYCN